MATNSSYLKQQHTPIKTPYPPHLIPETKVDLTLTEKISKKQSLPKDRDEALAYIDENYNTYTHIYTYGSRDEKCELWNEEIMKS